MPLSYHRIKGPGDFDAPAELELDDDDGPEDHPVSPSRRRWKRPPHFGMQMAAADPLVSMARTRRADDYRTMIYQSARTVAMRPSYGYSLLDAKAQRIRAEIGSWEAQARMEAAAAACVEAAGAAVAAWRGIAA